MLSSLLRCDSTDGYGRWLRILFNGMWAIYQHKVTYNVLNPEEAKPAEDGIVALESRRCKHMTEVTYEAELMSLPDIKHRKSRVVALASLRIRRGSRRIFVHLSGGDCRLARIGIEGFIRLRARYARPGCKRGKHVDDEVDPVFGVPVYSLYGSRRKTGRRHAEGRGYGHLRYSRPWRAFYTYMTTRCMSWRPAPSMGKPACPGSAESAGRQAC